MNGNTSSSRYIKIDCTNYEYAVITITATADGNSKGMSLGTSSGDPASDKTIVTNSTNFTTLTFTITEGNKNYYINSNGNIYINNISVDYYVVE